MFSFRKHDPESLLTSQLYDEQSFYSRFVRDLKQTKRTVVIESPYMTVPRATFLTPTLKKLVKRGVRVRINTRFPAHHDKLLCIQAWQTTKLLKSIGVHVYFYRDLQHRKIAILDGNILYEGSLNILSQNNSREVMRRIESRDLSKQMINFLDLKRWYWSIL